MSEISFVSYFCIHNTCLVYDIPFGTELTRFDGSVNIANNIIGFPQFVSCSYVYIDLHTSLYK